LQHIAVISHALLSPLGNTSRQCFGLVQRQSAAIREYHDSTLSPEPFFAARLSPDQLMMLQARYGAANVVYSPFEQMCLYVIDEAIRESGIDAASEDCILVLSSTKGNIEWLGKKDDGRIALHESARLIASYFGLKNKPCVVSNACISGSLALVTAARYLGSGRYKHAVVVGCDRLSGFVLAGFRSFKALADGLCRPFDKDRNGINLGEAAACMVLSSEVHADAPSPLAYLLGGGVSNDANHLSGPSRTGTELSEAILAAMKEAHVEASDIGMISAHGTATVFNDEMEAKALHLAGLGKVPLHSLKSYTGHTLGAAGIIESVIACMAMQESILPVSLGYSEAGVSEPVQVVTESRVQETRYLVKTASGFGGCNAALVWGKHDRYI